MVYFNYHIYQENTIKLYSYYMIKFVILAAGSGSRMKSTLPKVLHPLSGYTMLEHIVLSINEANFDAHIDIIINSSMQAYHTIQKLATQGNITLREQKQQLGTGDALKCAITPDLAAKYQQLVVLCGDTPLITATTLQQLLKTHRENKNFATCMCFIPESPRGYGRVIFNAKERFINIIEEKDLSPGQLQGALCNSGIMIFNTDGLAAILNKITPNKITGEFYLTDIYTLLAQEKLPAGIMQANTQEVMGVNTKAQLIACDQVMQQRIAARLMEDGALLLNPNSSYFARDVRVAQGVMIYPNVFMGPGVSIGCNSVIHSFSWLMGCNIGEDNAIGPFARIRPQSTTDSKVRVGNFVELKAASLGANSKASHLTYIGDAEIEEDVNIGAGTIFCNYDGVHKSKTIVRKGSFIGSNSSLIAPLTINEGSLVAAGSVITKDTEANKLAIRRASPQKSLPKK